MDFSPKKKVCGVNSGSSLLLGGVHPAPPRAHQCPDWSHFHWMSLPPVSDLIDGELRPIRAVLPRHRCGLVMEGPGFFWREG